MAGAVWTRLRQRDPAVVRGTFVVGLGLIVVGAWLRYVVSLPSLLSWLPFGGLVLPAALAFVYWSRAYLRWRALFVSLLVVAIVSGATLILVRELTYRTITTTGPCTVRSASETVDERVSVGRRVRLVTEHTYDVTWDCGGTTLEGTSRHDHGVEVGQSWEMTYDPSGRLAMRPADDGPALSIPAGVAVAGIWLLFLVRRAEERALVEENVRAERRRLAEEDTRRAMETLDSGTTLYRTGDHARAVEVLSDAVEKLHRLGDRPGLTDALHMLGLALAADGRPRVAVSSLETAVFLAAEINDARRHADAERQLSDVKAQLTQQPSGESPSRDTPRGNQRRRATTGTPDGTTTSRAGHVFYRIAATAGDVTAMHRLGRQLHDQGHTTEARAWLRRAASAGYEPSQLALDRLYGEKYGG